MTDSHGSGIRNLLSDNFDSNSVNISYCIKPNGTVNYVLDEMEKDVKRLTKKYYVIIAAVTNDVDLYMNDQSFIASHIEEKVKELVNTSFIVAALPYMYDEPFLKNKIKRINKQMERFCKKYIQINYLYPKNDDTKYGLHFNTVGTYLKENAHYTTLLITLSEV